MSKVQSVSKVLLRHLVDDFRERAFGAKELEDGYSGVPLVGLKQKCVDEHRVSALDFDLALNELENTELVTTGPVVAIENPPGAMIISIGLESKREYVCLTEKGYRMIQDFDFAFPDKVDVKTAADGHWHNDIKAQVERDAITLLAGKLPVAEGDQLQRKLPNGITEQYTIEHVEYQAAEMDFPAMIKAHVSKRGSGLHERRHSVQQNVYNLTGANPRVNVNSTDNSVNVLTVNSDAMFAELSKAIREQVQDDKLRGQLAALVEQMEHTRGTHEFTASFQSFMALAANCMTIVLPFIPALTQMLK